MERKMAFNEWRKSCRPSYRLWFNLRVKETNRFTQKSDIIRFP